VPGFYALKFLLYIWLFYPRANNGATVIFKAIHPYLLELQQKTESVLADLQKTKKV